MSSLRGRSLSVAVSTAASIACVEHDDVVPSFVIHHEVDHPIQQRDLAQPGRGCRHVNLAVRLPDDVRAEHLLDVPLHVSDISRRFTFRVDFERPEVGIELPLGRSVTRTVEADGRVIAKLSLAPAAAVTTRVEFETLTDPVRTVNVRVAGVSSVFARRPISRFQRAGESGGWPTRFRLRADAAGRAGALSQTPRQPNRR